MKINSRLKNKNKKKTLRKSRKYPHLKKGKDSKHPENYRPIALTSIVAKTAEHMINNRLKFFHETSSLLSEHQAGFRSNRSTTDQAIAFTQSVKVVFTKGNSTLAVLVDFNAAFNWFSLEGKVIEKMSDLKVPTNIIRWIKLFLNERYIRAKFQNTASSYNFINAGVPQGTVTSPIIFNISKNSLPDSILCIEGIRMNNLFAGDVIIWISGKSHTKLVNAMNLALVRLKKWTEDND
jgi:hypothetical protein